MDVSFIIPMIFDYPQCIMTINSIQAEMEYANLDYEIIMVENGFKDKYNKNFLTFYRTPINRNILTYAFEPIQCGPAARMKGLRMAKGRKTVFMDAHTILGRNSINIMLFEMEDLGAGIIHGATVKTHIVPPHVRGLHYRQFGNKAQNLNTTFHGAYSRAGQDTPYQCVGGNLAYTMFDTKELLEIRGYHPECRFYPHPEAYLPLKYEMLGKTVWAVPQAFHFHSVYRFKDPRGRQVWEIPIGEETYKLVGTDHQICNAMICAYTLGGEKWLDFIYDSWSKKMRSKWVLNGIRDYAKTVSEEEHNWVMNNMEKSLDEVLIEARKNKIKGMENWYSPIGDDPIIV